MSELIKKTCDACRIDAPILTAVELSQMLPKIPAWSVIDCDGVSQLERSYSFKNFVDAMAFAIAVGDAAEQETHHPVLLLEWGRVNVKWWTHKIKGLHKNDVIMAAKTDALYMP